MRKIYSYFIIISFFISMIMILSFNDYISSSASSSYDIKKGAVNTSTKLSAGPEDKVNKKMDDATEEISTVINAEF